MSSDWGKGEWKRLKTRLADWPETVKKAGGSGVTPCQSSRAMTLQENLELGTGRCMIMGLGAGMKMRLGMK